MSNTLASKARFLVCNSCFWCTSLIQRRRNVDRCPICNHRSIESLSLSADAKIQIPLYAAKWHRSGICLNHIIWCDVFWANSSPILGLSPLKVLFGITNISWATFAGGYFLTCYLATQYMKDKELNKP